MRSESLCSDVIMKRLEKVEWRWLMHHMIRQMMFVSGEEGETKVQTTTIIEEIVREQVVELVSRSTFQLELRSIAVFQRQSRHLRPTATPMARVASPQNGFQSMLLQDDVHPHSPIDSSK